MRKFVVFLAGVACLVLIVLGAWWGARLLLGGQSPRLADCAGKKFECYYQHLHARTLTDGPTAALADVKQAYGTDDYVRTQCHELVHVVGAAAVERYKNLQAALYYNDPMCGSGYQHGAEEEASHQAGQTATN